MDPSSFSKVNLDVFANILIATDDRIPYAPVSKKWQQAAEQAFKQLFTEYSKSQNPALQKWLVQTKEDSSHTLKIKHLYQSLYHEAKASEKGEKLLKSFPPHTFLSCEQLEHLCDQIEATWAHHLCILFLNLRLDEATKFYGTLQGSEKENAYQIKEWMVSHPEELAKVTHCSFAELDLSYLPKEIGMFKSLKSLYLDMNEIRDIPKEIGELENLEIINFDDNKIREVPKEMSKLIKLQNLILSNNNIQEIPEEIGELENLQELNLQGNQIREIFKAICKLNLKHLDLSNNQIHIIPEEIAELTSLEVLYLDNNEITDIPKEIGKLVNLQNFSLVGNKIQKTSDEVKAILEMGWFSFQC